MLQNYIRYRVLQEFFDSPTHNFHLREISRNLKLGLPSVRNHVQALEKEGFIIGDTAGVFKSYIANKDDSKYKSYKKIDMLARIQESGLVYYLIKELSVPNVIILFGSSAYGEDSENSDLDIAVIANKKDLKLDKFENIMGREIQLHFFKDIKDMKKSKELFNNIANGIILYGFLKVI